MSSEILDSEFWNEPFVLSLFLKDIQNVAKVMRFKDSFLIYRDICFDPTESLYNNQVIFYSMKY